MQHTPALCATPLKRGIKEGNLLDTMDTMDTVDTMDNNPLIHS